MRKIEGGPTLAEYINKEEIKNLDNQESLPPIQEVDTADENDDDEEELEEGLSQQEINPRVNQEQGLSTGGESLSQPRLEDSGIRSDVKEALESDTEDQEQMGRGQRKKLIRTFLSQ